MRSTANIHCRVTICVDLTFRDLVRLSPRNPDRTAEEPICAYYADANVSSCWPHEDLLKAVDVSRLAYIYTQVP